MREKLIELIEQVYFCSIEMLADHLLANGVTVQKWIPVSERLPDKKEYVYEDKAEPTGFGKYKKSDYVLVHTGDGSITVGCCVDGWLGIGDAWDTEDGSDTATHWMPLPEPPKGE